MTSAADIVETLCRRYAFGDVGALVPLLGLPADETSRLRRLCLFGQRLLDLDAEDFDMSDAAPGGPEYAALVDRARSCRMPQHPREERRGALDTMLPAYRLLLEVLQARYDRNEMAGLVATAHIIAEYLPLLIWETVWGHAADPLRVGTHVAGTHFGDPESDCAHHRSDRAGAARIQRIGEAPPLGWRTYLDRQHSNVAHALAVCAAVCRRPCGVVTRLDPEQHRSLARRCAIALGFADSALIKLRHAAPVGHGFGVPSVDEVTQSWNHTRQTLANRDPIAEAALVDDGYCLPGLPTLIEALADRPVPPDTLLHDTAELTVHRLETALGVLS